MRSFPKTFKRRLPALFSSIRFRLALWFVLILGLVIVVFSIFVYTRQSAELHTAAAERLEYKAEKLAGALRYLSQDDLSRGPWRIPNDPESGESFLQEGDVLALVNRSGNLVQSWGRPDATSVSLWVQQGLEGQNPEKPVSSQVIPATIEADNAEIEYLAMVVPIVADRRPVGYFLIANPVDPDNTLPRLLFSLVLGVTSTLVIALIGGVWLADRAMQPVKRITHAARTISDTDLSLRLQLNRNDELGELADTFDEMLARLEGSFERQRRFTADASHELRTPLSIVELETGRALAAPRSQAEYERVLSIVRSENQFMTSLVNNLLTLARMDAGQVALRKEEWDLSDITLEVVERLAPLAAKAHVRLSAGELPELPVLGDRQYLTQMITNLVENGIKYTEGEDRRVEVSTGWRFSPGGDQAWVRVCDNGPGIPPEHIPLLFDRFYQVDRSRTHQNEGEGESDTSLPGAGLGLSIARWVAVAHTGDIHVESELGTGTVFNVILPLLRRPEAGSQA
jgi:signal transduction histidine kinase